MWYPITAVIINNKYKKIGDEWKLPFWKRALQSLEYVSGKTLETKRKKIKIILVLYCLPLGDHLFIKLYFIVVSFFWDWEEILQEKEQCSMKGLIFQSKLFIMYHQYILCIMQCILGFSDSVNQ